MRPLLLALALVAAQAAVAQAPAAPPPAPAYAFGATGLRVTLPAGWDGPGAVDEARLPARAAYTFANAAAGPLAGAVLHVERAVGLNPVEQELWRQGRTTAGYGHARPVGPAAAPLPGTAFEIAGAGRGGPQTGGAIVFFQRGPAFWVVKAEAPAATWAARPAAVLALMAGVEVE